MNDDEWDQTYKANVMAHLWLMQSLEDELKANKGCFIVSASIAGLRPTGSSMAYCEFRKRSRSNSQPSPRLAPSTSSAVSPSRSVRTSA